MIIVIIYRRRMYSWSRPSRQPGRKSRMQSETTIAGQVLHYDYGHDDFNGDDEDEVDVS